MSEIHSIVFIPNRKNPWTTTKARKWLKKHNLTPLKRVHKITSSKTGIIHLRYRIRDPKLYKRFITKKTKEGINIIIGFK
jgi:hypothetical protein